ncbi:MAG TPA: methyl-accepting chemotaxis protein, partial [Fimbriimonadaceae bacterium]|nr:methyl-accepting chemotaxis protein [Fimbriimonadaceae bacterium]
MKFIKNLRIGAKLALGFGVCIAFLLAVVITGTRGMAQMNAVAEKLSSDTVESVKTCAALNEAVLRTRLWQFRYFTDEPSTFGDIRKNVGIWMDAANKAVKDYEGLASSDEDRKHIDDFKAGWGTYTQQSAQFASLFEKGNGPSAGVLFKGDMFKGFYDLINMSQALGDGEKKQAEEAAKTAQDTYSGALRLVLILSTIAAVGSIYFGFALTRQITRPVAKLSERMAKVTDVCVTQLTNGLTSLAQGDLTQAAEASTKPLDVESTDEIGKLMDVFNTLLAKTQNSIGSYNQCRENLTSLVRQLKGASTQMASASTALNGTAKQVESSAQEVGASMQEISSATNQAARGAAEVASGSTSQAQALSQSSMNIQKLVEAVQG